MVSALQERNLADFEVQGVELVKIACFRECWESWIDGPHYAISSLTTT